LAYDIFNDDKREGQSDSFDRKKWGRRKDPTFFSGENIFQGICD
jgi:hypothetical protein